MSYIIAGDIGATKALLEVYDYESGKVVFQNRYLSSDYGSLEQLIELFMTDAQVDSCEWACFADFRGPLSAASQS